MGFRTEGRNIGRRWIEIKFACDDRLCYDFAFDPIRLGRAKTSKTTPRRVQSIGISRKTLDW